MTAKSRATPPTWQAYYVQQVAKPTAYACPVCGAQIVSVRRVAPHHDPPRPHPMPEEPHA